MGGHQGHAHRRPRGPDCRLVPEGDRPRRRPLQVPDLLRFDRAVERHVQQLRLRGDVRGDAERELRLPDRRGLRAARGADRRRGHLHRAGPEVEGRALGVPPLHHRHRGRAEVRRGHDQRSRVQARAADGGQPRHRRVQPPVHGPRHADRHGRRGEPLLRRRQRRRHQGQPAREARGLHPLGLRGGRRDASPRPRPDGRQPDDLRLLRSWLRAAVVRRQRGQGAHGRGAPEPRADQQLPCRDRCRRREQGEGLLGRRHGADLRQPRRTRSAVRQHACRAGGVRDRPQPDHQPPSRT